MAISKITYKASPNATPETWMDSTGATAEAADILAPKTAMLANGIVTPGTGTVPTGTKQISITQNGTTTEDVAAYANAEISVNVSGGGGGGATLIASGTYTGTGTYPSSAGQGIFVGTRMPQTDFYVRFIAQSNSEFPYDTNYKYAYGIALVFSEFGHFDLSAVGDNKQMISDITYNVNNEGTITATDAGMPILFIDSVRNATAKNTQVPNNCRIDRRSNGFYFRLYNSSPNNKYESGITYDWEVVYFGSDPTTDIVSIA